jgi:hypothetical protein
LAFATLAAACDAEPALVIHAGRAARSDARERRNRPTDRMEV